MPAKYHQISLSETFTDCQNLLWEDSSSFFSLLSEHFDLNDFIPIEFHNAFYQTLGRKRLYPLHSFLTAFILQKIFSIPTDSLLLLFLNLCRELRIFCGFTKVPDASLMTRFKLDFQPYIELMFQRMVDYTEPICQMIDPYKMAYGIMPSQAVSCPNAKQMCINGHFCYADKFAILTNGLGIVRHIAFLDDDDFKTAHPELGIEKKSDSPDGDKSVGDSAFDTADIYGKLIMIFIFPVLSFRTIPETKARLKKLVTTLTVILPAPMILLLT